MQPGGLQNACLDNASFSCISTDAQGLIQVFNGGSEQLLGYTQEEVLGKISATDLFDPHDVMAHVQALSAQLGTPMAPGFEALVFKANRSIADVFEMSYIRKDGRRLSALVSVTALHDAQNAISGYLLIGIDNSARKQAEEALKEIERDKLDVLEKLNEAQEFALVGSWEWNLQTNQVWWSKETYRIFGVTPQNYVPNFDANRQRIHPEDRARYDQVFEHSLQTGEPLAVELRLLVNEGAIKNTYTKAKCVYDDAGQKLRFIGTIMDISEHKLADAQVAKKNRLLDCISKSQTAFIIEKDPMVMFTNVLDQLTKAAESEFGVIAETLYDAQGAPYSKVLAISELAWNTASEAMYKIAFTTGLEFHNLNNLFGTVVTSGQPVIANQPASDPRRGGFPEGHPPVHALLGIPFYKLNKQIGIYLLANRPGGYDETMVSYLQPFTDTLANLVVSVGKDRQHRQVINQLVESEQRYRSLVETAQTIVLVLGVQGTIKYVNPYLEQLTGYRRDEILGKDWFATFLPERDREHMQVVARAVLEGQRTSGIVNSILMHDGQERQIEWFNCRLHDEQGRLTGLLATGQDVTVRLATEQALQSALVEKDVLNREIHHRVKNNLQMISSLLQLQEGYVTDPQSLNYFKETQLRIKSMALIYEQLYHNTNLAQIDFSAYLRSLMDNLGVQFSARSRQVTIRVDAQACILPVDVAIPCGLIVNELVSNVFKHAFPNGRAGEVRVTLKCDDASQVVLEVADDGVGLPPGLDLKSNKTFGLRLLTLMVEKQLHGKLAIESHHGTRVVCEIGVPK